MIRVAIDAMGGDYAPREIVHGAVLAAREYGVSVALVGIPKDIEVELKRHEIQGLNVSIVAASEVVAMDEKPSKAVLRKKDSSIVKAMAQVAEGHADCVVACGSTGAAAVAATFIIGRLPNVSRCAIAAQMPTIHPTRCIVVDAGANVDCDANMLKQFGLMGSILYAGLNNVKRPRVGVLNIGAETTKGNELVQNAYALLKETDLNFIGFVEGRDYPMGKVDVVVTDGFTGNVSLKTAEGIAKMVNHMLRQELLGSMRGKIGGMIAKPAFKSLKARVDPDEFGGAPLVGLKGVCVIAHGGSRHTAVKNAIRVACDMVRADVVGKIAKSFLTEKKTVKVEVEATI
ncbi:MAG: phosphate acyltransferase PlsX [Candidatus Obscuribacter sp.]|jgi:glycerol-3-phosphate acyltransferase PlsX|nr:phosphate acyltransferase PlsX [Candidatus Obscuribacter sp.]MDQ5964866.1 Phosphate acyltransferase [Cyanobacteriota bacterium erpe_2018_sw_39hr_WHONDRS-SW48-000098_B_bin.30]MBK9619365.1 phosphate acyltransferase PlsX [Candidatus Obscuribacter sp.]MBL0184853.1 phosphate acyltransferase PlsX [Candidatus Obscuribacter sp.]MBP6348791.1 phosphate acyltransferase PlsX [Candidatus Obscuribacter sp.]